MQRAIRSDSLGKVLRYRIGCKTKGLKLLRLWVDDPRVPGFREEARRQAALLRSAPEEQEALDFIEAAADFGRDRGSVALLGSS